MALDLCGIQELGALTEMQHLSLAHSRLSSAQILPLSDLLALTHLSLSYSQVGYLAK